MGSGTFLQKLRNSGVQAIGWCMFLVLVPAVSRAEQDGNVSPPNRAQDAREVQDIKKSGRDFVQSFYDWYVKQHNWPDAIKHRSSAFAPELLRLLKEDHEAQTKATEGIAGLDWDPFLSGNDRPPGEHYVVERVTLKRKNTCLAEMHQVWSGKESEKAVVVAELANSKAAWAFVNFYYSFPNSDLSSSISSGGLVTILKNLREAREKAAKAPASSESTLNPTHIAPVAKPPQSTPTPQR